MLPTRDLTPFWFIGFLTLTLLLMLSLSACTPPTPTPTPSPTPAPILVPSRSNPTAGINGVAGGLDAQLTPQLPSQRLRDAAAQTSAQWDRIVVSWDKVEVETGDPDHPVAWYPERYDDVFAAETMSRTLAILTHRFRPAVTVDIPCVVAVINYLSRGEPLLTGYVEYHNRHYNCVRYLDYPYSYQTGRILYQDPSYQPPIVNGNVNPANDWARFVYETASRFYRDGSAGTNHVVDAWQIFNEYEAGFSSNWCPYQENDPLFSSICTTSQTLTSDWLASHGFGPEGIPYLPPPRVYAEMLFDAARVIHLVDPNAIVVLGGQWEEDLYTSNFARDENSLKQNWYLSVLKEVQDHRYFGEINGLGLHTYGIPARSYEFMHSVYANPIGRWEWVKEQAFLADRDRGTR